MTDVDIKFEREGVEGVVAVGSYLRDAMRRFGIRYNCIRTVSSGDNKHDCAVTVTHGQELLTPLTTAEKKFFGESADLSRRLACEARIDKQGEITIMTDEKLSEEKRETKSDRHRYIEEFGDLPLDKKISDLVKLEAMALGETISFILNSPYKVLEKIGDVMADLGRKMDSEQKKASRPSEHQPPENISSSDVRADTNTASEHA